MVSKTKYQFLFKDGFQKLVQRGRKCIEVRGDFVEKNNYAALKIIDVGIFLFFFFFIKISFPVHFLFKWRQNLSARPRAILSSYCFKSSGQPLTYLLCYTIYTTALPVTQYPCA